MTPRIKSLLDFALPRASPPRSSTASERIALTRTVRQIPDLHTEAEMAARRALMEQRLRRRAGKSRLGSMKKNASNNRVASVQDAAALDANFKPAAVDGHAVVWHDALGGGPFSLEGLPFRVGPGAPLRRLPGDHASPWVESESGNALMRHTAGACIRFRSPSPWIAVRATLGDGCDMNHMPRAGSKGLDLYRGTDAASRHVGTAQPNPEDRIMERLLYQRAMEDSGDETWQVNLPLYGGIDALEIGLAPGAAVRSPPAHRLGPICFYGSSITQGGCASRPGNAYTTMVCRAIDAEQINLGFSGSARGETAMAELIASLGGLSAFVLDYDYNAPTPEHLEATHEPFFRIVRAARPDLPILALSAPSVWPDSPDAMRRRRDAVRATVRRARACGDRNVAFLDGAKLFGRRNRDDSTVDRVHPNDLGFRRMADAVLAALRRLGIG